jgi:hypothetical protein
MSEVAINLTNEELVANAVRTMGWSEFVAIDTLIKALNRYTSDQITAKELLIALRALGYLG